MQTVPHTRAKATKNNFFTLEYSSVRVWLIERNIHQNMYDDDDVVEKYCVLKLPLPHSAISFAIKKHAKKLLSDIF
jgi:hypothetical protein